MELEVGWLVLGVCLSVSHDASYSFVLVDHGMLLHLPHIRPCIKGGSSTRGACQALRP